MHTLKKVNLTEAFSTFHETWSPRVGGDINDFQIKLAKLDGAFHWHHHEHEDELFLVTRGSLRMKLHERMAAMLCLVRASTSSYRTESSIALWRSRLVK